MSKCANLNIGMYLQKNEMNVHGGYGLEMDDESVLSVLYDIRPK